MQSGLAVSTLVLDDQTNIGIMWAGLVSRNHMIYKYKLHFQRIARDPVSLVSYMCYFQGFLVFLQFYMLILTTDWQHIVTLVLLMFANYASFLENVCKFTLILLVSGFTGKDFQGPRGDRSGVQSQPRRPRTREAATAGTAGQ